MKILYFFLKNLIKTFPNIKILLFTGNNYFYKINISYYSINKKTLENNNKYSPVAGDNIMYILAENLSSLKFVESNTFDLATIKDCKVTLFTSLSLSYIFKDYIKNYISKNNI